MKSRFVNTYAESGFKRKLRTGLITTLVSTAACGIAGVEKVPVFSAGETMNAAAWRIVNDGVMGGKSQSAISGQADGTLLFEGRVSLKNNGGFASTRSPAITEDIRSCDGIELMLTGDGKSYKCGIRTNNKFDGVTYQASFETAAGKEQIIQIPFNVFVPTWRGRQLSESSRMNPGEINNISFLISDKQEGAFQLEIKSISGYRNVSVEKSSDGSDIISIAREAGIFNTLLAAVDAAGLTDTVRTLEGITLFAPTDDAFSQLPEGTVATLLQPENRDQLVRILTYHVIDSEVPFSTATTLTDATAINGETLSVGVKKGALFLNESRVIENDIETDNGIIHIIDAVLLPPEPVERPPVETLIGSAISRGVPLFNNGNPQACTDLYELAAEALLVLPQDELNDHQRNILTEALARSKNQKDATERAWTMRIALDETLECARQ